MYMMLDYIWTRIKKDKRQRILIIDEAWWMMQYPDAARFVYSIAKRSRKYGLGLTTITQDVNDFLNSDYGKAVVNNSSIQLLLKQNPAAVDQIQKVFYLSDGEKDFLLSSGIGEGLFFADNNHVAIQIIASENEHNLITTNLREILAMEQGDTKNKGTAPAVSTPFVPVPGTAPAATTAPAVSVTAPQTQVPVLEKIEPKSPSAPAIPLPVLPDKIKLEDIQSKIKPGEVATLMVNSGPAETSGKDPSEIAGDA
jgi:hypothetical protein